METRVLDYLKEHPRSSLHQVAKGLSIPETESLRIIEKLVSAGLVQCEVQPLGNDLEPANSTYYSIAKDANKPD